MRLHLFFIFFLFGYLQAQEIESELLKDAIERGKNYLKERLQKTNFFNSPENTDRKSVV